MPGPLPNHGLKLPGRLAALARVHLGHYVAMNPASAAKASATA